MAALAVETEGRFQGGAQFFRYGLGGGRRSDLFRAQVFQHHHILVAADSGRRVGVAQGAGQAPGGFDQDLVARRVAQAVVEGLEAVEVEQQQGAVLAVAFGGNDTLLQPVQQQAAVGQAGKRVVEGQLQHLALCRAGFADVGKGRQVVADLARRVLYAGDGEPFQVNLAAFAPVPDLALPMAFTADRLPHGAVKGGVVAARMQ